MESTFVCRSPVALLHACVWVTLLGALPARAQDFRRPILERAARATVRVMPLGTEGRPVGVMGTGVVIDRRGYVLTNFHVVGHTRDGRAGRLYGPRVRVDTVADSGSRLRTSYLGTVVRGNTRWDLALIRLDTNIDGTNLPRRIRALELTHQTAGAGTAVAVLGFPQGVQSIEITYGHITNVIQAGGVDFPVWTRLDARINLGSSGGPVIDRRGRIVGIATLADRDG